MKLMKFLLPFLLLFTFGCSDDAPKSTGSVLFKNAYVTQVEKKAKKVLEAREKRLKSRSGANLVEGLIKIGIKKYNSAFANKDDEVQVLECVIFELLMAKYKDTKSKGISKLRDDFANKTGISIDSARMSWTIKKLYKFLNFTMELYVDRGVLPEQGTFSTEAIGNDAWGNDIRIYYPGEYKTMTGNAMLHFLIISAGRDGVYDNMDDMRLPFTKLVKLPKTKAQLTETRRAAKKIAMKKLKKIKKRDNKRRKKAQTLDELIQEDADDPTEEKKKRSTRETKSIDDLM